MRKIIYLLVLGGILFLPGCHDITVGYLFTEQAAYQVKTQEIYGITGRLEAIQKILDDFSSQFPDLQAQREELKAESERLNKEFEEFQATRLNPLYEEQDRLVEEDPIGNADRIAELDDLIWAAEEESMELQMNMWDIEGEMEMLEEEIKEQAGLSKTLPELEEEAAGYQYTIDRDVPWVTSPIEGVEGTEPLVYEIAGVKAATPEAAEQFRKYLDVMGGGIMYVRQDVDVPEGEYTVSLLVHNEGRSKVLEDVFTFVVIP